MSGLGDDDIHYHCMQSGQPQPHTLTNTQWEFGRPVLDLPNIEARSEVSA